MGDALAGSGRTLRSAFNLSDLELVEIDLAAPDAAARLNGAIAEPDIEFVFSHVGIGVGLQCDGPEGKQVNLWQTLGIPFISLFGDTPAYFFDRHVMPGPGFASFYAFPEHLEFRRRLPKRTGMLGNTPLMAMDEVPLREINVGRKSNGRLLFLKNGNDPEALVRAWKDALPANLFVMLADLASELASRIDREVTVDLDSQVCQYFAHRGLEIEDAVTLRLLFVAQIDDYLRRVKSTLLGKTLRNFPVDIHGFNWEHVDFVGGSARYYPGADFQASKQRIIDSLGIIDMSPNTSRGPHDRALRAYGLHTLCLTNHQEFYSRTFADHETFTYQFNAESIATKVAEVLARPKEFVERGVATAESFRRQYDPYAFVGKLLEAAACMRAMIGGSRKGLQDYFVWPPATLS